MPQSFLFTIRVYYEDTDAGGIVYYANYLKFMERARTEWLRALGFEQDALAQREGVMFVVRSANMEFVQAARFNDLLDVSVRIAALRGASMTFAQSIRRNPASPALAEPAADKPLCEAEIRVACIDAHTRAPRALPPALARRLKEVAT